METETVTLILTLMGLHGLKPTALAKRAKVSRAALSRYLNGETQLRAKALSRVYGALGANVDLILKNEINRLIGQTNGDSVGDDIKILLEKSSPIARKTITDTMISTFKNHKDLDSKNRIARLKQYRDSIKTLRRT